MDDSRLLRITAALDDARTYCDELLDELPSTSPLVLSLKRIQKHADADIDELSRHISAGVGLW